MEKRTVKPRLKQVNVIRIGEALSLIRLQNASCSIGTYIYLMELEGNEAVHYKEHRMTGLRREGKNWWN